MPVRVPVTTTSTTEHELPTMAEMREAIAASVSEPSGGVTPAQMSEAIAAAVDPLPTTDEMNAAISNAIDALPEPTTPPPASGGSITVTEHPDYAFQKDNTEAALRAAIQELMSTRTNGNARKIVKMRAGTTTVTSPDLLGSPTNGQSDPVFGFTLEGIGERSTTLAFNPTGGATTDPRALNLFTLANRARNFRLRGLKLTTNNPNANMLWAWSVTKTDANSLYPEYGAGQNQRFIFENVEWGGTWNRVIGIDGDVNTNNNSEWIFDKCATDTTARFGEAFLQSGGINGRNHPQMVQYLNYFVNDCNFTFNGGSFFRFVKGGNIHVKNGSWSAATNANPLVWFDIQGAGAASAAMLTVEGTRFEPKADDQLIIDNKVGSGQVTFRSVVDTSSLQNTAATQYKLHRYTARNGRFPIVTYEDSSLVGVHQYLGGNNNAPGKAVYKRNQMYQWGANNAVASAAGATDGFLQYSSGKPRHRFEDNEGLQDLNYN